MQRRQTPILFSIDKHLRCDDSNAMKSADSRNVHGKFYITSVNSLEKSILRLELHEGDLIHQMNNNLITRLKVNEIQL